MNIRQTRDRFDPMGDVTWEPHEPELRASHHPLGILRNLQLVRLVADHLFVVAPPTLRSGHLD